MTLPAEHIQSTEESQQVYLCPCAGRASPTLNMQPGHVYEIWIRGSATQSFLPLNQALAQYPTAIVSDSSSLCPTCEADITKDQS